MTDEQIQPGVTAPSAGNCEILCTDRAITITATIRNLEEEEELRRRIAVAGEFLWPSKPVAAPPLPLKKARKKRPVQLGKRPKPGTLDDRILARVEAGEGDPAAIAKAIGAKIAVVKLRLGFLRRRGLVNA